jgi:hypothetical protein
MWNSTASPLSSSRHVKRKYIVVPLWGIIAPLLVTVVAINWLPTFSSVRSMAIHGMPSSMMMPNAGSA